MKDSPDSSSYEKQNFREKKNKSKVEQYNRNMDRMVPSRLQNSSSSEDDIIRQSIEILFRNSNGEKLISELEEFFETAKLNKIYA